MATFIDRNVVTYIGLINALYNGNNCITVEEDQKLARKIQDEFNKKNINAIIHGYNYEWDGNMYGNKYYTFTELLNNTFIKLNNGITASDLLKHIGPYPIKVMAVLFSFIKKKDTLGGKHD